MSNPPVRLSHLNILKVRSHRTQHVAMYRILLQTLAYLHKTQDNAPQRIRCAVAMMTCQFINILYKVFQKRRSLLRL